MLPDQLFAALSKSFSYGEMFSEWVILHGPRIGGILLFAVIVYAILRRVLDKTLRWKGKTESGRRETLHLVLVLVLRVVISVATFLSILPELGIATGPLIASLGIFGLAFSFGAQTLVRDIVSGLFLLAEDLCRVGEEIEIGTVKGRVEGLRFRTLILRTETGSLVFFPYGEIKQLINHSRASQGR